MEMVQYLFQGIRPKDYQRMMTCFQAVEKQYGSGELIGIYGENGGRIGIVLEGRVQLLRSHYDGRQTILELLGPGDIFSEALSPYPQTADTIQVISTVPSTVQYIDYDHLIKRCPNACPFHSLLVDNALRMISQKAAQLSERLEVLSQRTIRDKLECYFRLLSNQQRSKTFHLPLSYSTLADYLSVDRSAMMRELKKMKEEKIIETDRHQITMM